MRNLATMARGMAVALLCLAPALAGNSLVGTWAAPINWGNQASGLFYTLQLTGDGHIREHVMNHMGMAYDLVGTYQLDTAGRTLRWTWRDYSPKRICVGGNCTPMGAPEKLKVLNTVRIQIQNANYFIGIATDGTTTNWTRTH